MSTPPCGSEMAFVAIDEPAAIFSLPSSSSSVANASSPETKQQITSATQIHIGGFCNELPIGDPALLVPTKYQSSTYPPPDMTLSNKMLEEALQEARLDARPDKPFDPNTMDALLSGWAYDCKLFREQAEQDIKETQKLQAYMQALLERESYLASMKGRIQDKIDRRAEKGLPNNPALGRERRDLDNQTRTLDAKIKLVKRKLNERWQATQRFITSNLSGMQTDPKDGVATKNAQSDAVAEGLTVKIEDNPIAQISRHRRESRRQPGAHMNHRVLGSSVSIASQEAPIVPSWRFSEHPSPLKPREYNTRTDPTLRMGAANSSNADGGVYFNDIVHDNMRADNSTSAIMVGMNTIMEMGKAIKMSIWRLQQGLQQG